MYYVPEKLICIFSVEPIAAAPREIMVIALQNVESFGKKKSPIYI